MNFGVKKRIEAEFGRRLARIFSFINKSIVGLTYAEAARRIVSITNTAEFDRLVNGAVMKMITAVRVDNARTWRMAAAKGTYGRQIFEALNSEVGKAKTQVALQKILMDNAQLIRSVPLSVARRLTQEIFKEYQAGASRANESAPLIVRAQAPWLSPKRAVLIARTETSKANSALTEVRSREFGWDWYFWRSSGDERVRDSHRNMDGVLVSWDNAPNPEALIGAGSPFGHYHAGCCPNCRCYSEPMLGVEFLPDSFRIYEGGGIRTIGKRQFMRKYGSETAV